jgi:hypothetical protein
VRTILRDDTISFFPLFRVSSRARLGVGKVQNERLLAMYRSAFKPNRISATVAISPKSVCCQTITISDRKIRERCSIVDANLLIDVV